MQINFLLYKSVLVAAIAGFLFGFDTVVISGAEKDIQSIWQLSDAMHGVAISIALWGTVLGALLGGIPTEYYGRKKTLIFVGFLYFISAIGSAIALELYSFIIFRFLGGIGIGISTIVAPLYISELSPPEKRGKLTGLFQFNIVLGVLAAYISNAFISSSWRLKLGAEAIPAIVFLVLSFYLVESPRWLIIKKRKKEKALKILAQINPQFTIDQLSKMAENIENSVSNDEKKPFFSKALLKPILLSFFIAFFNQLSGINAILYFAPRIFELSGLAAHSAMLQSIGIGITNLIFTLIGLQMIDKFGRKQLLYLGGIGYIVSLGCCALAFYYNHPQIVPICIFTFIASHAIGQGAVIWVFISEIFPNRFRARGQVFGCFTHWFFAALITLLFPIVVRKYSPEIIFGFFCAMMILQVFWIKLFVPETKGISLEDMPARLN